MTPLQAGWHVIGEPDPPPICPGSGQLVMAGTPGSYWSCPACGQMIRTAGDPLAIVDHEPPAAVAPTLSLGL